MKDYLLKGYVINENRTLITNENYINLINKVDSIDSRLKYIENNEHYYSEKLIVDTKLLIDNGWIEGNDDYVSLTDIARFKTDIEKNLVIANWMRKVDTLVLLKLWEQINSINFKPTDFEGVKSKPGENAFTISKKMD